MKKITLGLVLAVVVTVYIAGDTPDLQTTKEPANMELGAFSVGHAVKDLAASREFYEKIGFEVVGGNPDQNWQILRNGAWPSRPAPTKRQRVRPV